MKSKGSSDTSLRILRRLAIISWVFAALVVLAGSVVRMTGSGMGCPDWPRCFGLTIPPTDASQVTWQAGEAYGQGRMLIDRDTLWVAAADHQAEGSFAEEQLAGKWQAYTEHDYAVFNPLHTWVEFINRLLGALTGVPVLLLWGASLVFALRGGSWRWVAWSSAVLVALGAVAWLGKRVVDGNLIPHSITWHMLGALAILLLLVGMLAELHRTTAYPAEDDAVRKGLPMWALGLAAALALIQLITGTQVREEVDALLRTGADRSALMNLLPDGWKWHRSGAWAVLAAHLLWMASWWRASGVGSEGRRSVAWVAALLAGQTLTGLAFVILDMPAWSQPLHLLWAMGLLSWDGWLLLRWRSR